MQRHRAHIVSRAIGAFAVLAIVAGALAWVVAAPGHHGSSARTEAGTIRLVGSSDVIGSKQFTISGSVTGLYPGSTKTLSLQVHNPYLFPIYVRRITVQASDASPSCAASNVVTHNFSGRVRVPAMGNGTVNVPIDMVAGASNSCQNASFPLTYSGVATRRLR